MKNKAFFFSVVVASLLVSRLLESKPDTNPLWIKIQKHAQDNKESLSTRGSSNIIADLGMDALKYYNDKVKQAIVRAGVKKNIGDADLILHAFGLLGVNDGIKAILNAKRFREVYQINLQEIIVGEIGKALAIFWGIPHAELIARFGVRGAADTIGEGLDKIGQMLK